MAETFTYVPTKETQRVMKPRTKSIMFGNGYMQIAPDGINFLPEEWNLTFTVEDADKQIIDSFFKTAGGSVYFNWTSSEIGAVEKQYLCPNWQITPIGACLFTITATFNEWTGLV